MNKIKSIKNVFLLIIFSIYSFSIIQENPFSSFFSEKEYKKLKKEHKLIITNRGFDGSGDSFYVTERNNPYVYAQNHITLWNEAIFEAGLNNAQIEEQSDKIYYTADWKIELSDYRGYNFKVYKKDQLVATIVSEESLIMANSFDIKLVFKKNVKFVLSELYNSAK